ncbi:DUF255 domain-containing protein [Sulfurimonas sp.]|nr:DUF255 domain-containing protein [Sulfurimonas sp.]
MKLFYILLIFININANQLSNETSPYLKQHEHNPINWYAWNDNTLKLAKTENKPVFLSIGYSTCHWCHVMAEESFENEDLAKLFNKYFISIKVDKEEMPHIDSYYQDVFKKVKSHRGGWPLNIFMTPDKKVFYMSAYIPPNSTKEYIGLDTLLESLHVKFSASLLSEDILHVENNLNAEVKTENNHKIDIGTLSESINSTYDELSSGFGDEIKFPEASKVNLMLDLALLSSSKEMYTKAIDMLDAMALRGVYDHIDGGFFRYSVDVDWEIPHFEKMLYNQGELISLYSRAYSMTKKDLYKDVVTETIDMLDKRFMYEDLYYSASDAGIHNTEGRYFIYSIEEIESAINSTLHVEELKKSMESTLGGNFQKVNSSPKIHLNFQTNKRPNGFNKLKQTLSSLRESRVYPFIDKKINTAWNSLVLKGLYDASLVDKKYIQKADKHLSALKEYMFDKGELYHQSLAGESPTQKGFLEDYAYLVSALISGYEVSFDNEKLDFATYLLSVAKRKFYKDGVWYLSDDSLDIKADLIDVHYISPLSCMIQNLLKLASIKQSREYMQLANDSLQTIENEIGQRQADVPASAQAYMMSKKRVVTIKHSKEILQKNMDRIRSIKYPYIVLKEDDYKKYLACTMQSCFAVENTLNGIKDIIEKGLGSSSHF